MTPRQAVFLTARREVRERFRSRAFRASTAVQLLIVAAIVIVSAVASDDSSETYEIGVVGQEAARIVETAQAEGETFNAKIEVTELGSAAAAEQAVVDEEVQVALAPGELLVGTDAPDSLIALVQGSARSVSTATTLESEGLSEGRIKEALNPPPLEERDVSGGGEDSAKGLAFAGTLLLYIGLISFGYLVASGVIEEKSSRVVEVILSAISSRQLLAGKVIGIGFVGLAQLILLVAVGLILGLALGDIDFPSSTPYTAAIVALYFVLGYALYACAFAVAGSIVSRQEDTQSTTSPMIVVLVASYIASVQVIENPDGGLAQLCTFIPPVAPMVVPARAAQDAIGPLELAGSVALMVVATLFLIRLAATIYDRTVLRAGAPLKLTNVVKIARSDG